MLAFDRNEKIFLFDPTTGKEIDRLDAHQQSRIDPRIEGDAQVEPGLRAALKDDLPLETRRRLNQLLEDPPSLETLRSIWAIAVLERIGNAEAIDVLESLGKGASGARTTKEA